MPRPLEKDILMAPRAPLPIADFPRSRHCLRDVPDGESCWPDLYRQPDDHVALRYLESPAVPRGNTGLKVQSHDHQQ